MSRTLPPTREMIAQLISTPSVSCVHADMDMSNRAVIDLLAEWSESRGFSAEVQAVDEGKYNLIARAGSGSEGLVLSGHTDTVPCDPALWSSDPFAACEKDDRIYGLGSCDMKSFLALALEASNKVNFDKLKRPLTLVATADEETTMSGAKLIADNGKKLGRYCVIGEPTGLKPVRMHKGIAMEAIRLKGRSGHSSDPALGINALDGMHQALDELIAWRSDLQARYRNPLFAVEVPTEILDSGHQIRLQYVLDRLDRPLRVCGMVKNEGEPGGGPFWLPESAGGAAGQIVEAAQIDHASPHQVEIWESSTHFNPVDLVCGLRDKHGLAYQLADFIDPTTSFVAQKSHAGQPIKALERPGLWNGSMARWNTAFVEVPLQTFTPVKTVFDLLRPEHQP